jgi:hypothetical protein
VSEQLAPFVADISTPCNGSPWNDTVPLTVNVTGGVPGAVTVMVTDADIAVAPAASVARAVSV